MHDELAWWLFLTGAVLTWIGRAQPQIRLGIPGTAALSWLWLLTAEPVVAGASLLGWTRRLDLAAIAAVLGLVVALVGRQVAAQAGAIADQAAASDGAMRYVRPEVAQMLGRSVIDVDAVAKEHDDACQLLRRRAVAESGQPTPGR